MYFDGEIQDYRLIGKLNPDMTPETPNLSGLTRSDCSAVKNKFQKNISNRARALCTKKSWVWVG